MNPSPLPVDEARRRPIVMPVAGALLPYVSGLTAVEVDGVPALEQPVAPHEAMVLSVQLGREVELGGNTRLTGIRRARGSFVPDGDCLMLFALLTPLGAMTLFQGQPLSCVPRIGARVDELIGRHLTLALESKVALAASLHDKLRALADWLEQRATATHRTGAAAMRTARAATRVVTEPTRAIEAIAAGELLSRRQLERDFAHWLDTSPRHLSEVARMQSVARLVRRGESLAGAAAAAGFADQPHMSRRVRELTGLTPQRFVHAHTTPLSAAFRTVTGGGSVYL